ncbi:MAG: tripartite tricarboxylate transporter TctB family protein [Hyphomicrobiaceae bacterium]
MAVEDPAEASAGGSARGTRFNREIMAGLFLLACAAVGYYAAFPLDTGSMSGIGSGLLPKAVALGLAAFGAYLLIVGLVGSQERLEGFSVRGTIFVLGAILAFAATVRPLGLLIAGPLSMLLSSMADPETRPVEIIVFTACMTLGCYLLFKVLLHLPIPVLPPLLGY